jgi:cation diffusion facilitator family transporter
MTVRTQAEEARRVALKQRASHWALYSNGILLALKVIVGAITGSVAVFAEIVNSAADLAGALIVFMSVKRSDEPPDETHAYGHGKIENLSGVITATLILTGGFFAIVESVSRLIRPEPLVAIDWAVGVMLFSAIVNAFVSTRLLKVGTETESPALIADAHHLRTDVLTSFGVLVGLLLIKLTHFHYWDSIAALGVSTLILNVGYTVGRDSLYMLVDRALPPEEVKILEDVLRSHPEVKGFHRLRTRKAGSQRHADVHVLLDDNCTLIEAHRFSEELEDEMRAALPNLDAMVHPEPFEEETAHQREIHGYTDQNMSHSA